jgi:hypothetical protein
MCGGNPIKVGTHEELLEISHKPGKTDGATRSTPPTEPGGTPLAVASPVWRRPACETPRAPIDSRNCLSAAGETLGGLKPATVRLLERIADDAAARRESSPPPANIRVSAGTVLVREWHGKKHRVTVLEDGFLYRAKCFHSLSQIARTITGSRWSGPLFFGLKSARKEQTNEAA